MDRCIRCVSRIESNGTGFCTGCVAVLEKFRKVGTCGICWQCAEFQSDPHGNYCEHCGVELQAYLPFPVPVAAAPEETEDVIAALFEPPTALPCRGDTGVYDMSQHEAKPAPPKLPLRDFFAKFRKPKPAG